MKSYKKGREISKELHNLVPGGSHTYSKGDDQFPFASPPIISHADGAYCWDMDGNKFIDWAMGNRVFILGHNNKVVNNAAKDAIDRSTNYTRPGILEYEVAKFAVDFFPVAEMVKFGKNGSDVTTAAVKLSRAFTGRTHVAVCKQHPFFSIHDWFIGSTNMNSGVIESEKQYTIGFDYNDIDSVNRMFDEYEGKIACLILEPVKNDLPLNYDGNFEPIYKNGKINHGKDNFLTRLRDLCTKNGTVLIFDEMISGIRFDIRGAHHLWEVYPDLATYGKCISNGFCFSMLAGKKEIMRLGGLDHDKERVFVLSQTHGSETVGLAAAIATLKECERVKINEHIWSMGKKLREGFLKLVEQENVGEYIKMIGFDCNPQILCTKSDGSYWPELQTSFHEEVIECGVLIPWITITYAHTDVELELTLKALEKGMQKIKRAIAMDNIEDSYQGDAVKPVFRKYN
ncbi:glutamate-1-semialdehyde 2,1-aminomutase [Pedobacter africanus]|uniref:Glutamate-1-semialdehyde 2,1-aminomutase n=1 Tax=Pedobacter africanus TaxID=151894 RepID=A0ACC6L3A4_9SPHI|nr:glutamate-1-semialdehyde 2,1-aminomutase [Pedobacter africanus]MDR6786133.1 glutamate-1-semialdehyde 2,1-aminomutase [Pedobacter africanus]